MMVIEGNVHILQITDKLTTGAPYFVEMGHSQPAQLSEKIQIEVCKVAVGAVQAIGIDNGPAHVEMMGFLGMGNNPMVGATVAVAVAVAQSLK